jgi:tetratricopeptide (TPR) repeat protein
MIYSTIMRIGGLGLLFSIIAFSSYILLTDKNAETKVTPSVQTASVETAPENLPDNIRESDDTAETPIIKLASLSIITDYPAMDDSSLTAEMGMILEERLKSAKQLAGAQEFDEALQMLEIAPQSDQEAYSLNYLRAQILSWSGNHNKAERAFTELRQQYPQDADIAVSFGYLHLYQNNFEDAERLFTQVLDRFPDYQDAKKGLKRATAIQ